MENDFPRGGALSEVVSTKKVQKKRKKSEQAAIEEKAKKSRIDPEYEGIFTKFVSKELLTEDMRALGAVKKIKETEVVLETVNGLKVLLDARSISNEFTANLGKTSLDQIFHVGQLLALKVLKSAKQKNEEPKVTIDPVALNCHLVPAAFKNALVINGSVMSIEDKGAVINIGLSKVTGFVKNEDLPKEWKLEKLHIGQVLLFRVRRPEMKTQQRVIDLSAFSDMDVYADEKLSIADLMPGTIVSVEPDKAVYSGVFGSLLNGNKVYINKNNLPPRIRLDPGKFIKPIRAAVVCTLPNSPIFVLSAHPDIVASSRIERRQLPEEHRPGQKVKCTVYDVDKMGNVYFYLGEDSEKPLPLTAIMTKFNFQNYEEDIPSFKIGSTHECKIFAYRLLDRSLVVSNKKDVANPKPANKTESNKREKILTREQKEKSTKEKTVLVKKPAKPFQVYKAQVLGPWKHGKTSQFTTAELRLPGGTIGRLHASELDLDESADGTSPMIEFLKEYQGKNVEIKVMCVGNKKTINDTGKSALIKKCGTSRFVDCTAKKSKIAEPFRKLRYINFKLDFDRGDKLPIFIGDSTQIMPDNADYAKAEINPLYFARVPRLYIDSINNENDQSDAMKDAAFKFVNGEMCRGLVISQQRTARVKTVNVALGSCIIKEEKDDEVQSTHSRKRHNSQNLGEDEPEPKVFESLVQDPGFDFSLGMFSMNSMARIGKNSTKKASEASHESSEEEDELEIKDEPDDESDDEAVLRRERRIAEKEARLREAIPENATDFDRLLTGSANSSDLWIKYITYFLRDEKVKEARKIAERALSVINFREEVELFNVWTAYLNLEVMFGDAESLKAVFDRAVQATDSLKMHKQMARVLAHHKKIEQLDEHFENMVKKFRHEDLDIWYQYGSYLYESERLEDARQLLQKALNSLGRKHHLSLLSRFAQMEYRFGDAERAKTMFEKILQTYPKKTDIWGVYMDMSLKHEGISEARKLFQRAVSADLGAYRTRVFYEKWMKAEEKFGDAESLEMVEEHAKEFLGNRKAEQDEELLDD
ncbi:hypothetical protein M3Y97_01010400 [Aphelenchoides bicaudatus]|nr:hypothetical protein M3Y97_01010400 [Aphelenchoides bicaudatus]